MLDYLCEVCASHFELLKGYLGAMGLEYAIDPRIVRGLLANGQEQHFPDRQAGIHHYPKRQQREEL